MNPDLADQPLCFEPRLPRPEECSLGLLLQQRPKDAAFAVFENGELWTNGQAFEAGHRMARKLSALGLP